MYKLIFEDDFNYEGKPNPKHWNVDTGGWGFGNNESQHYTDRLKNVFVKDSLLHLVAYKEDYEENKYTSGKVNTYGKMDMMYGKIEVKAKLPLGLGTWPAIWMLGNNIKQGVSWPACGEIDIMEFVGQEPDKVLFSLHSQGYNHKKNNNPHVKKTFNNLGEKFQVFSMIWEPDKFEFYVDGIHQHTIERKNKTIPEDWPFQAPFYLILNLAIGGTLGGEIDDSIFPVKFLIDYVKVYEKV